MNPIVLSNKVLIFSLSILFFNEWMINELPLQIKCKRIGINEGLRIIWLVQSGSPVTRNIESFQIDAKLHKDATLHKNEESSWIKSTMKAAKTVIKWNIWTASLGDAVTNM